MAFYDTHWYLNSVGHAAVAVRPQNAAVAAGVIRRQFTTPSVGAERCFICIVAGTTANTADATWSITRGAKTTDGTAQWQECTGMAAVNGDATNTPTWTQAKAIGVPTLGAIIKRDNGASYWICSIAGTMGASEPAWPSNTAGATRTDGTTTWTCLGVVGNFTGGQVPHARLANVFGTNWFIAGNTCYVADNHAETQSTAMTVTPPTASVSGPGKVLCHNRLGSYPPAAGDLTTGATVITTGNSSISLIAGGPLHYNGITFQAGSGASGTAHVNLGATSFGTTLDNCSFQLLSTGVSSRIFLGGVGGVTSFVLINNCTVKFSATGQAIDCAGSGNFVWQNTAPVLAAGSTVPNFLFSFNALNIMMDLLVEAIDLSAIAGTLVNFVNPMTGSWTFKDCKLHASVTPVSTLSNGSQMVQFVRCDSGTGAYKSARYTAEGSDTTESTITRVGGAVDPAGQAQTRKIVTGTLAAWLRPFRAEPYAMWNARVGSNVTVTVCGTINAGAVPNNDDIWMEVEYLSDSASPLGKIVNTTKASVLAANAAVDADGSTWNTPATSFDGATNLVALSNGNLTVLHNNTNVNAGAVSTAFQTGGKYYFEVATQTTHSLSNFCGIISSAFTGVFSTTQMTNNGTVVALGTTTAIYSNGADTGLNLGTTVIGDVFCFAVDLTARLAWIRRNGGNWNASGSANPATGVGGVTIQAALSFAPIIRFAASSFPTDQMTANFGASAYAFTPPAGFGDWDDGWTPFKLTATLSSPQPQLPGYLHTRIRAAKPSTTFYIDPQIALS